MYLTVTRKKYKDTYYEQILLRESYREDGKVKTRTIANLTVIPHHFLYLIFGAEIAKKIPNLSKKWSIIYKNRLMEVKI